MDMCTNRINGDDDDDDQFDVRNDEHDEYDSGTIVILLFKRFKIISMLETLGVDQDQFEEFISGINMHCRKIDGLEPGKIASYLAHLLAFSKTVQFSQIQQYIDKKKKENGDLEQYKQKLESQIQNLEKEESNSKAHRDASLYNEKIINDEIEAFSNLKTQLQKYGWILVKIFPSLFMS